MTSSLRIAYLCLQATTEGQASYAHVHEIINGLRELGHSVDLYEPRYAGGDAPGPLGRVREFLRLQREMVGRFAEYDVLYVRAHALALPAALAALRAGLPTVQECNGPHSDFVEAWPAARPFLGLLSAMSRFQYRRAQAVVAVTASLAEWVTRDSGQPKVEVVGNGVNVDLFKPSLPRPVGLPEQYAVLFGALQPWQGIPTVLAASQQASWPHDLPIVFVGNGRAVPEILSAAEAQPDRVMYLGRIPYREVPRIVSSALVSLVVCSPEHRAASGVSPLKLYESMACGVPVVAGDLAGMRDEVSEARCGVLIDAASPREIADAVAFVAADPELARSMGDRGREAAVGHHSWRAKACLTDEVLRRVAGANAD